MVLLAAFTTAVIGAGLAIVALISALAPGHVHTWADAGQAFGAIGAVLSGLGLIAIVVTFMLQYKELVLQREELGAQRVEMFQTQRELHRSAEASIRGLHVELLKMALNEQILAEVWPRYDAAVTAERDRQFMYANLIIQHVRLMLEVGDYDEAEVAANLDYLLRSPIVREFWSATTRVRRTIPPEGTEARFFSLVERVIQQIDSDSGLPAESTG